MYRSSSAGVSLRLVFGLKENDKKTKRNEKGKRSKEKEGGIFFFFFCCLAYNETKKDNLRKKNISKKNKI